jgi:hypothetical protein
MMLDNDLAICLSRQLLRHEHLHGEISAFAPEILQFIDINFIKREVEIRTWAG